MRQVLFHIPTSLLWNGIPDIPIYGYGFMLFVAFVFCVYLAARQAKKEGVESKHVQDLAIWIFLAGIAGARLTFMIQYGVPLTHFLFVWDGGLVFYGSAIGGAIGYVIAYQLILRKHGISSWKMADILAPCIALGLAIGRIGCLLNGCCYGGVAAPDSPGMSFPLASPPRYELVGRGWQTAAGFTVDERLPLVLAVEPRSQAAAAGLQPNDRIATVNGKLVDRAADLDEYFDVRQWPRGKNDVQISVMRAGNKVDLPAFGAWTIGLNPTQLYETISMLLLFLLLMAYMPFKKRDGSVLVLLMVCYSIHRFFNEMLRDDTKPVAFNMTLSQNISILMLVGAVLLGVIVWLRPTKPAVPAMAGPTPTGPGDTAIKRR